MGRRIIITIVDGLHFRYLIESKVIHSIVPHVSCILILTSASLMEKVRKEFVSSCIQVQELLPVELSSWRKLYLLLKDSSNKHLSETINVKNELKKKKRKITFFIGQGMKSVAGTPLIRLIDSLLRMSFRSTSYRALLGKFEPDIVVFSTPGQKIEDLLLLYECKKKNIKTISPVYSWDNLTAKGPFIFNVDRLIVWNQIMKIEAQFFHDYSPEQIEIAGVPVFDPYFKVLDEPLEENRLKFLKELNLSPELPTLTVTTIPRIFFGNGHNLLIRRIIEFIERKEIPISNILIRPHPKDDTDYSYWNNLPNVTVDNYGTTPDDTLKNWIPEDNNTIHLARTMKYSDIVINIASTITIDAACFDTPVINIAYDMKENDSDYEGSIERYFHYTHYKHVVDVNAVALVKNDQEFVKAINDYLNDRSIQSNERKLLVKQQTGVIDGKAHQRVAQSILKFID